MTNLLNKFCILKINIPPCFVQKCHKMSIIFLFSTLVCPLPRTLTLTFCFFFFFLFFKLFLLVPLETSYRSLNLPQYYSNTFSPGEKPNFCLQCCLPPLFSFLTACFTRYFLLLSSLPVMLHISQNSHALSITR